jgi:hypothetical protein
MGTTERVLIITAICTGIGTIITAWAGLVRSKREAKGAADDECRQRLADARAEAEQYAEEVHALRMKVRSE